MNDLGVSVGSGRNRQDPVSKDNRLIVERGPSTDSFYIE
jgi:hypothetical protein